MVWKLGEGLEKRLKFCYIIFYVEKRRKKKNMEGFSKKLEEKKKREVSAPNDVGLEKLKKLIAAV